MPLDLLANLLHLPLQLRQRSGVALFQLINARGEALGEPLRFTFNSDTYAGEPLVLNHQRLNLSFGEFIVLRDNRLVEDVPFLLVVLLALRLILYDLEIVVENVKFLE